MATHSGLLFGSIKNGWYSVLEYRDVGSDMPCKYGLGDSRHIIDARTLPSDLKKLIAYGD